MRVDEDLKKAVNQWMRTLGSLRHDQVVFGFHGANTDLPSIFSCILKLGMDEY
jgi:hypothetical protein